MLLLYNNTIKFEYDPQKSKANQLKHGITLEEAKALWVGPIVEVEANTIDEPRFIAIGKIQDRFYSCVYTYRDQALRLISARRSRKSEEDLYHEYIKT